jgi:hypothetical protein
VIELIEHEIYRRLRRAADLQLRVGRYVEFGKQFAVGPHELICGEQRWSWGEVEEVRVANHRVQILGRGNRQPLAEVPVSKVPSPNVLVDVCQALLQARRRG